MFNTLISRFKHHSGTSRSQSTTTNNPNNSTNSNLEDSNFNTPPPPPHNLSSKTSFSSQATITPTNFTNSNSNSNNHTGVLVQRTIEQSELSPPPIPPLPSPLQQQQRQRQRQQVVVRGEEEIDSLSESRLEDNRPMGTFGRRRGDGEGEDGDDSEVEERVPREVGERVVEEGIEEEVREEAKKEGRVESEEGYGSQDDDELTLEQIQYEGGEALTRHGYSHHHQGDGVDDEGLNWEYNRPPPMQYHLPLSFQQQLLFQSPIRSTPPPSLRIEVESPPREAEEEDPSSSYEYQSNHPFYPHPIPFPPGLSTTSSSSQSQSHQLGLLDTSWSSQHPRVKQLSPIVEVSSPIPTPSNSSVAHGDGTTPRTSFDSERRYSHGGSGSGSGGVGSTPSSRRGSQIVNIGCTPVSPTNGGGDTISPVVGLGGQMTQTSSSPASSSQTQYATPTGPSSPQPSSGGGSGGGGGNTTPTPAFIMRPINRSGSQNSSSNIVGSQGTGKHGPSSIRSSSNASPRLTTTTYHHHPLSPSSSSSGSKTEGGGGLTQFAPVKLRDVPGRYGNGNGNTGSVMTGTGTGTGTGSGGSWRSSFGRVEEKTRTSYGDVEEGYMYEGESAPGEEASGGYGYGNVYGYGEEEEEEEDGCSETIRYSDYLRKGYQFGHPGLTGTLAMGVEEFVDLERAAMESNTDIRIQPPTPPPAIMTVPRNAGSPSESFITRRWSRERVERGIMPTIGDGNGVRQSLTNFFLLRAKENRGVLTNLTPAFWAFWLGFLCPVLWLVGGWLFTSLGEQPARMGVWEYYFACWGRRRRRVEAEEVKTEVPQWISEKQKTEVGRARLHEPGRTLRGISFGYPFIAKPASSRRRRRLLVGLPNRLLDEMYGVKLREVGGRPESARRMFDPWIQRCRYAFCYGCVLLALGLCTATIYLIVVNTRQL